MSDKKEITPKRSKYNWAKLQVNQLFQIEGIDFQSMKTSLRQYNERHKVNIQVAKDGDINKYGQQTLKRIA